VTYRIKGGFRTKLKIVHFDRLKPYLSKEIPEWVHNEIRKWNKKQQKEALDKEMKLAMLDDTILYDYDKGENKEAMLDETILYDYDKGEIKEMNDEKLLSDHMVTPEEHINENITSGLENIKIEATDEKLVNNNEQTSDKQLNEEKEIDETGLPTRKSKRTIRIPERYRE
jgi:hypothetical protein